MANGLHPRLGGMLEVIIERWTNPDGSTDYMWSVWQSGESKSR